jgi:hypothetical protein
MKKIMILLSMVLIMGTTLSAEDYGAQGAGTKSTFTLEEMLLYALQDEHLALAEYEAIMTEFEVDRPYANIAQAERTHITYVEELYTQLGWPVPAIDAQLHTVLPSSLEEAAEVGVKAEIENIAMYEKFLTQDLPANVRDVFIDLKESSEKHLTAFERQLSKNSTLAGRGLGRGRGRS